MDVLEGEKEKNVVSTSLGNMIKYILLNGDYHQIDWWMRF